MRIRLAMLVAALALGVGTATAGAERKVELTPTSGSLTGVRADSSPTLTFTHTGGAFRVICQVNRRINFEREIEKTVGDHAGEARDISIHSCSGGQVRSLTNSWRLSYVGFTGTLPNISSLRLKYENVELLVKPDELFDLMECLYRGHLEVATDVPIRSLRFDGRVVLAFDRALNALGCASGSLAVGGTLTLDREIRLRLA